MRALSLAALLLTLGCSEERPESETVYETSCEEVAATGSCAAYDFCCTDAVHLENEVEVDRFADSCWYDVDTELFDCSSPANCTDAEAGAEAMACGTR